MKNIKLTNYGDDSCCLSIKDIKYLLEKRNNKLQPNAFAVGSLWTFFSGFKNRKIT